MTTEDGKNWGRVRYGEKTTDVNHCSIWASFSQDPVRWEDCIELSIYSDRDRDSPTSVWLSESGAQRLIVDIAKALGKYDDFQAEMAIRRERAAQNSENSK